MEVALRQRLEGVANVSISESQQTTEVIFAPGDHQFSLETFRQALRQADVDVVAVEIDACGTVATQGGQRWLRAGKTDLVLQGASDQPDGSPVCVSGRLQQDAAGMHLTASRSEPAPESFRF